MRVYFRFVRSAVHIGLAKTPQVDDRERKTKKHNEQLTIAIIFSVRVFS